MFCFPSSKIPICREECCMLTSFREFIHSFLRTPFLSSDPIIHTKQPDSMTQNRDNVIFGPDQQVCCLLDFEEVCEGCLIFDVVSTVCGCCFPRDNLFDISLFRSFLEGYSTVRLLSSLEVRLFVPFFRYACLCIALWRFRSVFSPALSTGFYSHHIVSTTLLIAGNSTFFFPIRISKILTRQSKTGWRCSQIFLETFFSPFNNEQHSHALAIL